MSRDLFYSFKSLDQVDIRRRFQQKMELEHKRPNRGGCDVAGPHFCHHEQDRMHRLGFLRRPAAPRATACCGVQTRVCVADLRQPQPSLSATHERYIDARNFRKVQKPSGSMARKLAAAAAKHAHGDAMMMTTGRHVEAMATGGADDDVIDDIDECAEYGQEFDSHAWFPGRM